MSSKEETSTAAVAAVAATTAPTTPPGGGSATGFSYANVLQNVDAKKVAGAAPPVATAPAPFVATEACNDKDEKEKQHDDKANKSWSDEVDQEAALSGSVTAAGEKRAAANTDTAAENSSEVDDNGDFVPVVSNHRRDRKKARKDKPRGEGRNNGGNGQGVSGGGGQKSGQRQRGGNGSGAAVGASDKEGGERKYPPRQRQRNGSPRKSAGGGQKSLPKEQRKDASPSASAENTSSGNEAKTGDGETQTQISAAGTAGANSNPPQPKKFVAAPPPKVNAWKVSTVYILICFYYKHNVLYGNGSTAVYRHLSDYDRI